MTKLNKYPHISVQDLELVLNQVICELYTYSDYPANELDISMSKEAIDDGDFNDYIIQKSIKDPSEYKKQLSIDVVINRVYIFE